MASSSSSYTEGALLELPNQIIVFPNKDKEFHEKWTEERNLLDFPHPVKALFSGKTNFGKTTLILNLIARARPEFERIMVYHCGKSTKEYDELGPEKKNGKEGAWEKVDKIPPPDFFDGNKLKTLFIIEDINFEGLKKDQKFNLDRLFGYVATHCNVSVYLTSQNFYSIPTNIRRMGSLLVLGKNMDAKSMKTICSRTQMKPDQFQQVMDLMRGPHDSLWIDETAGSPAPIRVNGYNVVLENSE